MIGSSHLPLSPVNFLLCALRLQVLWSTKSGYPKTPLPSGKNDKEKLSFSNLEARSRPSYQKYNRKVSSILLPNSKRRQRNFQSLGEKSQPSDSLSMPALLNYSLSVELIL